MPTDDDPKPGRPTLYREEYAEQAHRLALLGLTDAEMAQFFEVSAATLYRWKNEHPQFCESISRGKLPADANVALALYQRACGCSHPEFRVSNVDGQVVITDDYQALPARHRRGKPVVAEPTTGPVARQDRDPGGCQFHPVPAEG